MTLANIESCRFAGGPMTLAIRWSHVAGDFGCWWSHEGAHRHTRRATRSILSASMDAATRHRLQSMSLSEASVFVDKLFDLLHTMRDDAYDLEDDEAAALCQEALDRLDDTLKDESPTQVTLDILPDLIDGPVTRAFALVRPDIRFPNLET
jgi:hypothetical protein